MADTHEPSPDDLSSARHGCEPDDRIAVAVTVPTQGAAIITVEGELDMLASPQLRAVMLDTLAAEGDLKLIVLGLDGVTFLGTSGLAVLIEVREAALQAGVRLRLACTGRRVLRPLSIAGLLPIFDIHGSVEAALEPS